jgi:lipopolysaccharide export system permease protein
MLQNGQRIEQVNGKTDIRVSDFALYGTRMGQDVKTAPEVLVASVDTLELLRTPSPINLGELSWRLGICFAAFNLVLLSVAITSANPRVGRSGNFAFAFCLFVLYYNFINLGNTWIAGGKSDFAEYLIKLHGGFFLCGLMWLLARDNNWSPSLLWRRSKRSAA